jgi:hypothetical protein
MISVLTRLGLDPWEEAGRLSLLGKREAIEQLARLIAEVPGIRRPPTNTRDIAAGLVERLPAHDGERRPASQIHLRRCPGIFPLRHWPTTPRQKQILTFCLVAAAAALVSTMLHGAFPFGLGSL